MGGDECSMDLMVVQRRLWFFEASLMRSRLAAANDEVISLFAEKNKQPDRHGGQAQRWKPSIAARACAFVS